MGILPARVNMSADAADGSDHLEVAGRIAPDVHGEQ
jgi:hypothetical protein